MLGIAVNRDVFAGAQESANCIRLDFFGAQRDHIEQTLRLRTIVLEIPLARKHHDADVLLEVPHLRSVKREIVPTGNRRLELVIKERVRTTVVLSDPRKEQALFVFSYQTMEGRVAIHDGISDPDAFRLKAPLRQGELQHLVRRGEVRAEHLASQHDLSIGIKVMRAAIFGNRIGKVETNAQQIVDRLNKFMAADSPKRLRS